jgi:hypothetical protein
MAVVRLKRASEARKHVVHGTPDSHNPPELSHPTVCGAAPHRRAFVLSTYNRRRIRQGCDARSWEQYVKDNSNETVLDKIVADTYTLPESTKAAMSAELGVRGVLLLVDCVTHARTHARRSSGTHKLKHRQAQAHTNLGAHALMHTQTQEAVALPMC